MTDWRGTATASGLLYHQPAAEILTLRDGKLVRLELGFANRAEALEAAGLREQPMSRENVELARRGYAALNAVYKSGDVNDLLPLADELWDPDVVLNSTGTVLAGGEEWHGHEGVLRFIASQMEAFQQMRLEALEFIEAGDRLVVPVRFGGRARHTGIEIEFPAVHVLTIHDGRVARMDVYETKDEALKAVGLTE